MKITDFINNEKTNIELYACKKPKYHQDTQSYHFENDSLLALSPFDQNNNFENFFPIINDRLKELFSEYSIEEYTNANNYDGYIFLNEKIKLSYQETLIEQLTSLALIESESVNYNYLLIKIISETQEMLVWLKLKSPLKILNNTFFYQPDVYEMKITNKGVNIDNFPKINFSPNDISFLYYNNDFYILNRDLFQKYFNLNSFAFYQAQQYIDQQKNVICDNQVVTKSNAKLVYENFQAVDYLCEQIQSNQLSILNLTETIDKLNLDLSLDQNNKFILKKPSDLIDLILLANNCMGINQLTDEIIKVKKPQYLIED